VRIWVKGLVFRQIKHPALIQEASRVVRNVVLCDHNSKVVADRNQTSIEHPVHCSRKSQAVPDSIRTIVRDRLDVCGLYLGSAPSIYQSKTGKGTSIIVCYANCILKRSIPKWPRDCHLDDWTLKLISRIVNFIIRKSASWLLLFKNWTEPRPQN